MTIGCNINSKIQVNPILKLLWDIEYRDSWFKLAGKNFTDIKKDQLEVY